MNRFSKCLSTLAIFTAALSMAQEKQETPKAMDNLTITATRTETPTANLGQSFTIISQQELAASKSQSLTDALKDLTGIDLKSYGPYDSNAQISIRGMDSYHTKVLVDGIPFMDNSSTQSLPILGNISLSEIDHIEILRGATSLQGSSAMGGVINIITKVPEKDGLQTRINMEAGSHSRFNTNASILGKFGPVDFKAAIGRNRERGISVVETDQYGNVNADNDHYRDMTYSGKIGFQFTENWRIELGGSFQDIDEEYDSGYTYDDWMTGDTIAVKDTDDVWCRRNLGYAKIIGKDLFDGKFDTSLTYAMTRADRAYLNKETTEYRYIGDTGFLAWQGTLHINETNDLTIGLERQTERARNISFGSTSLDEEHRSNAVFLGYQVEPVENLFLSLNGRYTHHSEFGGEWTGDAAAKYYLENTGTTFKASVGKGYRSPSVYELFAPANGWGFLGGNPDLVPETNVTWEVGAEQELLDKQLTIGSSYFENEVDDFITSTATSFGQIDGVSIRGIESFAKYAPSDFFVLKLSHIYQRARDTETGNKHIAYIPRHKIAFNSTWYPLDNKKLTLNLGGAWTGDRWNASNSDGSRSKLQDFLLIHTAASYKITDNLEVYARIENLLNTNYTLSDDYGTRYSTYGRCYYAGLVFTF